jgi:hypothetical protein
MPNFLYFQTYILPDFHQLITLANNNMADVQLLILKLDPIHGPYSDYRRNTTCQENQPL